MIKNLVFDVGKVIKYFDPIIYLMEHYDDFETIKLYQNGVFASEHWDQLDLGELNFDQIAQRMVDSTPEMDFDVVKKLITNYPRYGFYFVEPIKQTIEKLRTMNRWKFYLLSNYNADMFRLTADLHPFLKTFDGQIISGEEKVMKPDPRIYQLLLDRYDLKAEECVFVDDRKENVDAAIALGMEGVVYTDSRDLLTLFEKIM